MRRTRRVDVRRVLWLMCSVVLCAALVAVPQGTRAAVAQPSAGQVPVRPGPDRPEPADWATWQKDLSGSRYASGETSINRDTVGSLAVKWAFTFPRIPGVYPGSQPAVVDGTLYVGSTDAKVYALDARTGATRWVYDLTPVAGPWTAAHPDPVRDGPAVADGTVYFGDSRGYLFAVSQYTGRLRWATLLDTVNPDVRITSSPIVFRGRVYVGVSNQEGAYQVFNLNYPCCTARGELVAVDARTGAIAWRHYTVPPAQPVGSWPSGATEYAPSGGSVWATPVIDPASRTIFVGTAQNYTGTEGETDSVLAVDTGTGKVRWSYKAQTDTYTNICGFPQYPGYCPGAANGTDHDWDFSSNGNLFRSGGREVLGIGEKNGVYRAFDAATGTLLWSRSLSARPDAPGGNSGIQWGTSYDGRRLYVATWLDVPHGTVYALDPATGAILWQTPGPLDGCSTGGGATSPGCTLAFTPAVTSSPGLVFEGSGDGKMYAFSSATGELLWQYDTVRDFSGVNGVTGHGESVSGLGGAVVVNGMVYVQSGYYPISSSPEGTVLLAFGLTGGLGERGASSPLGVLAGR